MMKNVIASEVVVAYSHCPRKAFLLLFNDDKKAPEYVHILEKQARVNRIKYLNALNQDNIGVSPYNPDNIENSTDFLIEATLKAQNLEAYCDVLRKVPGSSSFGKHSYEPMIIVGTYSITKEQKIKLAFIGHVLGYVQNELPAAGSIVVVGEQTHKVKLNPFYTKLKPIIQTLKEWIVTPAPELPPIILNRHCPYCQFQNGCTEKAEEKNDLSLLDRMTLKVIQRYHKKGIFTITQLSYLFKPRRKRKQTEKTNAHFNPELQALAIRTRKIYIQELPNLPRQQVELFLDIEGIPDQNFYYLIGLIVYEGGKYSYQAVPKLIYTIQFDHFLSRLGNYHL